MANCSRQWWRWYYILAYFGSGNDSGSVAGSQEENGQKKTHAVQPHTPFRAWGCFALLLPGTQMCWSKDFELDPVAVFVRSRATKPTGKAEALTNIIASIAAKWGKSAAYLHFCLAQCQHYLSPTCLQFNFCVTVGNFVWLSTIVDLNLVNLPLDYASTVMHLLATWKIIVWLARPSHLITRVPGHLSRTVTIIYLRQWWW